MCYVTLFQPHVAERTVMYKAKEISKNRFEVTNDTGDTLKFGYEDREVYPLCGDATGFSYQKTLDAILELYKKQS